MSVQDPELIAFARSSLVDGLSLCTEPQQLIFKRMYSHEDLEKAINDVVNDMEPEKLETAMRQVRRTVTKNKEKEKCQHKANNPFNQKTEQFDCTLCGESYEPKLREKNK